MTQMLQVEKEIDGFADIVAESGALSYLEIGSKFGGSLERVARRLPEGSRVVAVDLPNGTRAWSESRVALGGVMSCLNTLGHETHMIWGDSTDPKIIEQVRKLGPFDAIFIDANHTLPYVEKDWSNYGPMGKIVAFHDIAWHRAPEWVGTRIDVPQFWDRVKHDFRHVELKYCETGKNNGIGVLWR